MVNIQMKKGYGVIYVMQCFITRKMYIGQALNFTSGNVKYSGERRVIVHFREAFYEYRNHCRMLNEAIREHGVNSFLWCNLKEVPENELNYWESYYVEKYNTLHPNGYNLTKGGDQNNVSETRKKELIQEATDRALKRCPKYVFPIMRDVHVEGYYVEGYPCVSGGTYPKKEFTDVTHNSRNLKATQKYINYLKVLNDDVKFDDKTYDIAEDLKNTISIQTGLPKHIYRVYYKGKQIGYEITNFKTKEGNYVFKKFNDSRLPLEEKYKLILEYLKKLLNKT
jgi:hypothetical protein